MAKTAIYYIYDTTERVTFKIFDETEVVFEKIRGRKVRVVKTEEFAMPLPNEQKVEKAADLPGELLAAWMRETKNGRRQQKVLRYTLIYSLTRSA